jgi:hypothetical protein
MFCENCGSPLPPGAKFCETCGTPVGAASAPSSTGSTPPPRPLPMVAGRSLTATIPAVICLISTVFFSLVVVGSILLMMVAMNEFRSYTSILPIDLFSSAGSYVLIFGTSLLLAIFLPVIIVNYRAFRGLWRGEADGYKWGLLAAFYGFMIFLPLMVGYSSDTAVLLLLLLIPAVAAACLLLDKGLAKLTPLPLSLVIPSFLSLTFFCLIAHFVLITAVVVIISLVTTASIRPYINMLMSLGGAYADLSALIVIGILVAIAITGLVMLVFYRVYRDLLDLRHNANIAAIVVYSLLTLIFFIGLVNGDNSTFPSLVMFAILAAQVVLLLLKSTRQLFAYQPYPSLK